MYLMLNDVLIQTGFNDSPIHRRCTIHQGIVSQGFEKLDP